MSDDTAKRDATADGGKVNVILTDYHTTNGHRPYTGVMCSLVTDQNLGQLDGPLLEALGKSGAVDGDEIEITIRRTGCRPVGNRRVRLVEPHRYERETVEEASERLQKMTAAITKVASFVTHEMDNDTIEKRYEKMFVSNNKDGDSK